MPSYALVRQSFIDQQNILDQTFLDTRNINKVYRLFIAACNDLESLSRQEEIPPDLQIAKEHLAGEFAKITNALRPFVARSPQEFEDIKAIITPAEKKDRENNFLMLLERLRSSVINLCLKDSPSSYNAVNVLTLPIELLMIIASHLEFQERMQLRQVCKRFKSAIEQTKMDEYCLLLKNVAGEVIILNTREPETKRPRTVRNFLENTQPYAQKLQENVNQLVDTKAFTLFYKNEEKMRWSLRMKIEGGLISLAILGILGLMIANYMLVRPNLVINDERTYPDFDQYLATKQMLNRAIMLLAATSFAYMAYWTFFASNWFKPIEEDQELRNKTTQELNAGKQALQTISLSWLRTARRRHENNEQKDTAPIRRLPAPNL
jgi:hypothetical protein